MATGWTTDRLTAAVRAGRLYRPAPGKYAPNVAETAAERYRTRVLATATGRSAVVSHESAAALHGIPYLRPTRDKIHFTVNRSHGGGLRGKVHLHSRPLRDDEIMVVDGVRATDRARTAVDCGMTGDLERAVCAFDAVRHVLRYPNPEDPEPVPLEELRLCIDRLGRRRGVASARLGLELSVTCSGSPGESWSRIQMRGRGLPTPQLQTEHVLAGCTFYTDFEWGGSLVGEFDGRDKYGETDDEVEEALAAEKARQEHLEAAGFEVIRWRWRVLNTPGRLEQLLLPAMRRHGVVRASA
ncbi:hypothetical protein [Tsukamurella sp. PLM1]|uniref:type IV toxin-antitoxin system AbiEi family antitoxin domain-containing protein n=1 Tax=Tsukamurella sp. PLM1 TaxID=2929795 RepID=UPI002070D608|nr:hypothetical protein [Tsukamurella sp. PLM1]BDH58722.1 hypothetical protein MTP03_36610 [Tsukamurella sp. PLM1]